MEKKRRKKKEGKERKERITEQIRKEIEMKRILFH